MINLSYMFLLAIIATSVYAEVKFYSFAPQQPPTELPIDYNAEKLSSYQFDRSFRRFKILCHGWEDNITSYWYQPTADNYLHSGEKNVIAIDWGFYAQSLYPDAVEHARNVSEIVGQALILIQDNTSIPFEEFHLIGHSLGAHVMGLAGQYVLKHTNRKIGRVTGLDPAGPSFEDTDRDLRLSSDDAYFVDVIHTHTAFAGYKKPIGHIDFWPNGGKQQVGCDGDLTCSHLRAPIYFSESINSTSYPAWYCDSEEMFNAGKCFENVMIYMGDHAPSNIRGEFYLNTNPTAPFGKTDY